MCYTLVTKNFHEQKNHLETHFDPMSIFHCAKKSRAIFKHQNFKLMIQAIQAIDFFENSYIEHSRIFQNVCIQ